MVGAQHVQSARSVLRTRKRPSVRRLPVNLPEKTTMGRPLNTDGGAHPGWPSRPSTHNAPYAVSWENASLEMKFRHVVARQVASVSRGPSVIDPEQASDLLSYWLRPRFLGNGLEGLRKTTYRSQSSTHQIEAKYRTVFRWDRTTAGSVHRAMAGGWQAFKDCSARALPGWLRLR